MAAGDEERRGAAIYGREPDAALIAALVAAEPVRSAPETGEEASHRGRSGRRPPVLTAVLVAAAAVVAAGVAVHVGTFGRRAAPAFQARPSATAIADELTRTRTIPVSIAGAPEGCRVAVELTLRDPSLSGIAQLARLESFLRTHEWSAAPTVPRGTTPSPDPRTAQSLLVFTALRQGMTEFQSRPRDAHWPDRVAMLTTSRCDRD
ncbi:hypothetical protein GCM10025783_14990 [Amnibacterium soli]|uniref:FtsX extracellular domain-containing protein n=1 Tax=Amnibacterium soli TaxID=1282736 RepID=A0ABP8Z250_9MICO